MTVPCSELAIVQTGLSQLTKVCNKSHFTIALISGLGGLLTHGSAEIFAQKVSKDYIKTVLISLNMILN